MMGLVYELTLRKYDTRVADTPSDVPAHWKAAIYWWNDVAEQPDFWHVVSENVSALGDPRVDFRFARALKEQFAFAFDQINVELAIDFVKQRREADAKRQVEYMKLSQPDTDDVEGTFDEAFAGLLRQTEAIIEAAVAESNKNPKDGFRQANAILERTGEPLRISRTILPKGTSIRTAICTTIFGGVRSCLIAYGNDTTDWDRCLNLTKQLKQIAETDEQRRVLGEDEKIIADNKKTKEEEGRCWFCKRNHATPGCELMVPMYGDVQHDYFENKIRWRTIELRVPRCSSCKSSTAFRDFILRNTWIFVCIALFSNPIGWMILMFWVLGSIKAGVAPTLNWWSESLYRKFGPQYSDFPQYKELKSHGWEDGKRP